MQTPDGDNEISSVCHLIESYGEKSNIAHCQYLYPRSSNDAEKNHNNILAITRMIKMCKKGTRDLQCRGALQNPSSYLIQAFIKSYLHSWCAKISDLLYASIKQSLFNLGSSLFVTKTKHCYITLWHERLRTLTKEREQRRIFKILHHPNGGASDRSATPLGTSKKKSIRSIRIRLCGIVADPNRKKDENRKGIQQEKVKLKLDSYHVLSQPFSTEWRSLQFS